jgi:hypothetical protein
VTVELAVKGLWRIAGIKGHESERQLWFAVIEQAIVDAAYTGSCRKKNRNPRTASRATLVGVTRKRQAIDWVGTPDFRSVCALAGIDQGTVGWVFARLGITKRAINNVNGG